MGECKQLQFTALGAPLLLVVSHLYRVEMLVGSLSCARDLLCVERENPLVLYPILDPCQLSEVSAALSPLPFILIISYYSYCFNFKK